MVLGKLPVPGRPTIWITVEQGPTALAVCADGVCLDIFTLIYPFSSLSTSLWETARYRLKYCFKGLLNPNNQPTNLLFTCERAAFTQKGCVENHDPFGYVFLVFLLFMPRHKKWRVLCYTLRTFECLSVRPSICPDIRPSVHQQLIIPVRSITLIPFEIISRNLAQI